jgi:hypothetical protein
MYREILDKSPSGDVAIEIMETWDIGILVAELTW